MLTDWTLEFTLDTSGLREIDPLFIIMPLVQQTSWLRCQHTIVHIIVSELYTNALDHGILQLDPKKKLTALGFSNYQVQKQERLQALSEGWIKFQLKADDGCLYVSVSDSGKGFAYQEMLADSDFELESFGGRGLLLLNKLCSEVIFHHPGNHIEVKFKA